MIARRRRWPKAVIADAGSFALPISNPANLVLYGGAMPPLGAWLRSFDAPLGGAICPVGVATMLAVGALARRLRVRVR